MTQEDRYRDALHAMQTGVKMMREIDSHDLTEVSLRVGINSAMCDSAALAKLLISKGLISQDEYEKAIAEEMEREVERYRLRIKEHTGAEVGLV